MDDDELLEEEEDDAYAQRGIILLPIETEIIAHMLAGTGSNHIRVVWQHNVPIVWPMDVSERLFAPIHNAD